MCDILQYGHNAFLQTSKCLYCIPESCVRGSCDTVWKAKVKLSPIEVLYIIAVIYHNNSLTNLYVLVLKDNKLHIFCLIGLVRDCGCHINVSRYDVLGISWTEKKQLLLWVDILGIPTTASDVKSNLTWKQTWKLFSNHNTPAWGRCSKLAYGYKYGYSTQQNVIFLRIKLSILKWAI